MKIVKCHVFKFEINTPNCTPNDFYEFDEYTREMICPLLCDAVGADAMNEARLVPQSIEFNPDRWTTFFVLVPCHVWNEEFDKAIDAISDKMSEMFSSSSFEQEEDDDVAWPEDDKK